VVVAADLAGPSGGGLSLEIATATVTACTFTSNVAMSTDFVLVANPDLPQARGNGLFISSSPASIVVSGSVFSGNQAYYGGGVYAFSSSQQVAVAAGTKVKVTWRFRLGSLWPKPQLPYAVPTDGLLSAPTSRLRRQSG